MNRDDIIDFMRTHPNVKISHSLFDSEEYIFMKSDGNIYDENNYLFENWYDKDGFRMRSGGIWEDGWFIKEKEYIHFIETEISSIEDFRNTVTKNALTKIGDHIMIMITDRLSVDCKFNYDEMRDVIEELKNIGKDNILNKEMEDK